MELGGEGVPTPAYQVPEGSTDPQPIRYLRGILTPAYQVLPLSLADLFNLSGLLRQRGAFAPVAAACEMFVGVGDDGKPAQTLFAIFDGGLLIHK